MRLDKRTNPNGNFYEIRKTEIATSVGLESVNPATPPTPPAAFLKRSRILSYPQ